MANALITQATLATLEKGLNKLLAMDSSAMDQLSALEGRVIAIQSTTPNYSFYIIPTVEGVFLTQQIDVTVDAKLTAPAPLLLQLLLTKDKQSYLKNSSLMIVGEASLLYQFFAIFDELNPDWEHELSQWFGPTIVSLTLQSLKIGNEQLKQGMYFIQSKLANIIDNQSKPTNNMNSPTHSLMDLINSIQKRFG